MKPLKERQRLRAIRAKENAKASDTPEELRSDEGDGSDGDDKPGKGKGSKSDASKGNGGGKGGW